MELLRIDEQHDAYYLKNHSWSLVRDIERDDLLYLIQMVAENDEIEMAECTSDNEIINPIEKTIYLEVYSALKDLADNRETLLAEIDAEFEELERKYCLEEKQGDSRNE